ncbi:exosome complex component RRP41 [Hydra vulgaris]|uniref:Exosome complex component RRP41 n=1 Tax=Hydra vulgaris TaxID=6087 RepID=A0ABM4BSR1_HYDVU
MAGLDLVSPEGLRFDGRKCHELRKITAKKGIFSQADGSAYIEQGNTKVIASVYGPHEVSNRSKTLHDSTLINCQFSMATFSMSERKNRPKGDRKSTEISMLLEKTFATAIMTELYPRSQIDIYVQVIQSDGGIIAACINVATLALIDAGVPMKDFVCACTSSYVQEKNLTDINHLEESSGSCQLTLAMLPRTAKVVAFQVSSRLHLDNLEELLKITKQGCLDIYNVLQQAVEADSLQQAVTLVV